MSNDFGQVSRSGSHDQGYIDGSAGTQSDRRRATDSDYDEGVLRAERERRRRENEGQSAWRWSSGGGASQPASEWVPQLILWGIYAWLLFLAAMLVSHVVEPLVTLIWRPLFRFGLLPESPIFYVISYGAAAVAGWLATLAACDGRIKPFRRFTLVVLLTTATLEALRFAACWQIDLALQGLGWWGVCKIDVLATLSPRPHNPPSILSDYPFLAWAESIGIYVAASIATTGLAIFIGLCLFWRMEDNTPSSGASS
jgi:hypothetical protein